MTIEETEHEEKPALPEHKCPVTTSFMDHRVQSEPWEFISELHEKCPVHKLSLIHI